MCALCKVDMKRNVFVYVRCYLRSYYLYGKSREGLRAITEHLLLLPQNYLRYSLYAYNKQLKDYHKLYLFFKANCGVDIFVFFKLFLDVGFS